MKLCIVAVKRSAFAVLIAVAITLGWAGFLRVSGNFHEVEKGKLYRSAQLSGDRLKKEIAKHNIRTVINLRGANVSVPWYDEELASVGKTNATYVNFAMSSGQELTDEKLEELKTLLSAAQQPVLVHCEAGADRSGLVSAIYSSMVLQKSPEVAASELSFRYGHFPWLRSSTAAMDRTLDRFLHGAANYSVQD